MKHTASTALLAGVLMSGIFGVAAPGFASVAAPNASPLQADPEVLEAEPVDSLRIEPADEPTHPAPLDGVTADDSASASDGAPYDFAKPRLLLPYYLTAYIPPADRTELNLGLLLSQSPGIDVSLGWGVMDRTMLSARISALGASYTAGLGLKYLFLPELPDSSKPAVSALLQALFLNHRTLGEVRENVFRGSRIQTGFILSKDLGILARSLGASRSLQDVLSLLRLHGEALLDFQIGRENAVEAAVSRLDFGAKLALEAAIQPEVAYAYFVLDTLPDWIGDFNYYFGGRFYSQPDLAFDALIGRIQNNPGLLLTISWIF